MTICPHIVGERIAASEASTSFSRTAWGAAAQPMR